MPQRILNDERRGHATQSPPALRVGAAEARLPSCISSGMHCGIDLVGAQRHPGLRRSQRDKPWSWDGF